MRIGARLRSARLERGLTLADVASDRLSVGLVSKLERDLVNPSLQTLCYLASRLGIPPGVLLRTQGELGLHNSRGALASARAHLLLGDPAPALAEATSAEASLNGEAGAGLRARLLAVAAEASLSGGSAGPATSFVRDASALLAKSIDSHGGVPSEPIEAAGAQVEIAWVLGNLERRRGALADAERTWDRCLSGLDQPLSALPWWSYLRAGVLSELGGLAEARGDLERARNLVARAASIASGLAHSAAPAATLLAAWTASEHAAPDEPIMPAAALSLAVVSAAERLGRRLTLEAARLERAAWAPEVRVTAPDASASRGLGRA